MNCKGLGAMSIFNSVLFRLFDILSNAFAVLLICTFWLNYRNFNSLRFELDTNYLRWTSRLPAISVCQADEFISSRLHTTQMDLNKLLHGLIRPRKKVCNGCTQPAVQKLKEFQMDFNDILKEAVSSCQNLFDKCFWNNKSFDCCKRFSQLRTKRGICYSANSQMTENYFLFSVSHFSKDASLIFTAKHPIQVFIHDPKDVLFITNKVPVVSHRETLFQSFSSREVLTDQSVWDLTVQQRGCILPGERPLKGHPKYSASACKVECEIAKQIEVCGCYHHLNPKIVENSTSCSFEGLQCIDYHFNNPDKPKRKELLKLQRLKCNCLPSCEETEVKMVRSKVFRNQSGINVHLDQLFPPTERLILKARVTFLDALVFFACVTRLVTNVSLLRLAKEALFWIFSYKSIPSHRNILY